MNCWHCNTELVLGSDYDISEEDEDYSLQTELSCPSCASEIIVYCPITFTTERKSNK
tara:strand:+ start:1135 stop:1305 length:171 start_codon:yes stop_codon:yes gene_type:complete